MSNVKSISDNIIAHNSKLCELLVSAQETKAAFGRRLKDLQLETDELMDAYIGAIKDAIGE